MDIGIVPLVENVLYCYTQCSILTDVIVYSVETYHKKNRTINLFEFNIHLNFKKRDSSILKIDGLKIDTMCALTFFHKKLIITYVKITKYIR